MYQVRKGPAQVINIINLVIDTYAQVSEAKYNLPFMTTAMIFEVVWFVLFWENLFDHLLWHIKASCLGKFV